jgi:hypothetical protein
MSGKNAQTGHESGPGLGTRSPEVPQRVANVGVSETCDYVLSDHDGGNPAIFEFLDRILSSEEKTRRLGYLIQLVILGIIASAGLLFALTNKAPPDIKYSLAGGSALLITCGRMLLNMDSNRRARKAARRARRKLKSSDRGASASTDSE